MDLIALGLIHWLHVLFAIHWFGGAILARRLLFLPSLRGIPEHEPAILEALAKAPGRNLTVITSNGTVLLGAVRGAMGGALSEPASALGLTYLTALAIGLFMLAVLRFDIRGPIWDRLYMAGFPVLFALMVAMRFGW